jgi:hypothetical protein
MEGKAEAMKQGARRSFPSSAAALINERASEEKNKRL